MRPSRLAGPALVFLALLACGSGSDLDDMLAAGADSADVVASYYDTLSTITLDSWRVQAVSDALNKDPASAAQIYEDRIQALAGRAGLAHQLSALFAVMTKSRDAAGLKNVTSAGEALGKSMQGVPNLPGAANLEPGDFGKMARFFVDLKRQKDLRLGLKSLQDVLTGMQGVFERERREYVRLSKERNESAEHLLALLSEKKLASPAALLKTLPLGVPIADAPYEEGRLAGLAMAKIDVFRAAFTWDCTTREIAFVLAGLIEGQQQAAAGASPDLRSLRGHIGRANGCLAEYRGIARVPDEPKR